MRKSKRKNVTRTFNWKKFRNISAIALVVIAIVCTIAIVGTEASLKAIEPFGKVKDIDFEIAPTDYGFKITKNNFDDFRILQLTDIHIGGGILSIRNDKMALTAVAEIVQYTRPDLIIATGDIAYPVPFQSGTIDNKLAARIFATLMDKLEIPWTITFGNHDTEVYSLYNRADITEFYKNTKYGLLTYGPDDIQGYGNQIITIHNPDDSINMAVVQIDSNDYIKGKVGINHYDKIHDNQIEWYRDSILALSGDNEIIPSLMFFHIPIQEYRDAYALYEQGSDEVKLISGAKREDVCCSDLPSIAFETILELGSTKALFCGHDHVNDFIIEYKDILLVYGKSIDYLAYAWKGIIRQTEQRGGTVIDIAADSTFEITSIRYSDINN